jgi:hypothetical protein
VICVAKYLQVPERVVIAALIVLGLLLSRNANGTELKLLFKNQDGKPVNISKAELLLVAWGYTDRVKLDARGSSLTIPMDASWLQSHASDRFQDMEGIYLYIEASDFAPIRSEKFNWPSSNNSSTSGTHIKFPNTKEVEIIEGSKGTLDIVFRRPKKRNIQFLDDENKLFPGVKVKASMFWSASNHCGRLTGADDLIESESDQNGRVAVPDGDFEYVLEIESRNAVFKTPTNSAFSKRQILRLNNDITVIQLHRRLIKPLKLKVEHNGLPVTDEMLWGCAGDCLGGVCESCCGPFKKTDKNGIIDIPEFYPEMYSRIFFAHINDNAGMDSIEEAKPLWEMKPLVLPDNAIIKVDLK